MLNIDWHSGAAVAKIVPGTDTVGQGIKSSLAMLASHTISSSPVLGILPMVQLPAKAPGRAEDGSRAWDPASYMETGSEFLAQALGWHLGQDSHLRSGNQQMGGFFLSLSFYHSVLQTNKLIFKTMLGQRVISESFLKAGWGGLNIFL